MPVFISKKFEHRLARGASINPDFCLAFLYNDVMRSIIVRNKNIILELLNEGVSFESISVAQNIKRDGKINRIVSLGSEKGIRVREKVPSNMIRRRDGSKPELIYGVVSIGGLWSLNSLIDSIYKRGEKPFFLLMNRVDFPVNIGTITRTAFAAGVNGIIFQGKEKEFINDDSMYYSRGALARIPLVKTSIFGAIKTLQKEGTKVFALEMGGDRYFDVDLRGAVALVLGDESEGLSNTVLEKCDGSLSVPMKRGMDSLNVSVSTSLVLYEKVRQEGL